MCVCAHVCMYVRTSVRGRTSSAMNVSEVFAITSVICTYVRVCVSCVSLQLPPTVPTYIQLYFIYCMYVYVYCICASLLWLFERQFD